MLVNYFLVIRHSERLDEVNKNAFRELVKKNKKKRDTHSLENDPPLSTKNGSLLAGKVALTIKSMSLKSKGSKLAIYCSKLTRAAQTAHRIALELNIPIFLSSGLSMVISAVKKTNGNFQFESIVELSKLCPGVEFIDCDDAASDFNLPTDSWRKTVEVISSRGGLNIIVAHRETIRKLAGSQIETPHCCIGVFNRHKAREGKSTGVEETCEEVLKISSTTEPGKNDLYELRSLFDCEGKSIEIKK